MYLPVTFANERRPVSDASGETARMDKIERVLREHPLLRRIVDQKLDVGGKPGFRRKVLIKHHGCIHSLGEVELAYHVG